MVRGVGSGMGSAESEGKNVMYRAEWGVAITDAAWSMLHEFHEKDLGLISDAYTYPPLFTPVRPWMDVGLGRVTRRT